MSIQTTPTYVDFAALAALLQRPADSAEAYDLHLAAHEWSLATALAVCSPEDLKSLPNMKVEPYNHQINAALTYFRRLFPRGMIADDVGLGKTITAGLVLSKLMLHGKVKTCLVVCPKMLLTQWQRELEVKFGLKSVKATGADIRHVGHAPVLITTYDSARRHMATLRQRAFDMLIMDEAHKVRTLHGVRKPAKRAQVFHEAMQDRVFPYVLQLTATPLQTSIWDVYSLADILRVPDVNPFGGHLEFERQYLATIPGTKRPNPRAIRPSMTEEFRRRLSEIMVRTRRKDTGLAFPDRLVRTERVDATAEELQFIQETLQAVSKLTKPLEQITLAQSALSSPWSAAAQLQSKLGEMVNLSHADKERLHGLINRGLAFRTSAKLKKLIHLVRTLKQEDPANWRLVVFTTRRRTVDFIRSAMENEGLGSHVATMVGGQASACQAAVDRFDGRIQPHARILISTDVGAEGLNLQISNIIVNFDLPWNPMVLEQRIGRVQRLGQKAKYVVVYNLVVKQTVEERVVVRLAERLDLFQMAIGEMEEILAQAGGKDDEGKSFENLILELVLRSLGKQDVEADIEAQRASIQAARERMRELDEAIEKNIGRIDPERVGPILPNLRPTKPRISLSDFVLRALTHPGRQWKIESDGVTFRLTCPERDFIDRRIDQRQLESRADDN